MIDLGINCIVGLLAVVIVAVAKLKNESVLNKRVIANRLIRLPNYGQALT